MSWESKGANIFILWDPYLASFVIRTLPGGVGHQAAKQQGNNARGMDLRF